MEHQTLGQSDDHPINPVTQRIILKIVLFQITKPLTRNKYLSLLYFCLQPTIFLYNSIVRKPIRIAVCMMNDTFLAAFKCYNSMSNTVVLFRQFLYHYKKLQNKKYHFSCFQRLLVCLLVLFENQILLF